jgi:hypothetical protein
MTTGSNNQKQVFRNPNVVILTNDDNDYDVSIPKPPPIMPTHDPPSVSSPSSTSSKSSQKTHSIGSHKRKINVSDNAEEERNDRKKARFSEEKIPWRNSLHNVNLGDCHNFKTLFRTQLHKFYCTPGVDDYDEQERENTRQQFNLSSNRSKPSFLSNNPDDINPQNTLRRQRPIGPDIDEPQEVDGSSKIIDNLTVLKRLEEEDLKRYNIRSFQKSSTSSKNLFLRRQLLVYLSKINQPIFQFIEQLAAAYGNNTPVENFIWVFPEDIEILSQKDPRLYNRQTYEPEDFVKELMTLLANPQGISDRNFQLVLRIVNRFVHQLDDIAYLDENNNETSPQKGSSARGSSATSLSTATATTSTTTAPIKVKREPKRTKPRNDSEDEEPDDIDEVTLIGSEEDEDSDPQDDEESHIVNIRKKTKATTLVKKSFKEWQVVFDNLFREQKADYFFEKDTNGLHPLALLVLKPSVRGQMRLAQSEINTQIGKDYTLAQYIFSDKVSAWFARYMVYVSSIAMSGFNLNNNPVNDQPFSLNNHSSRNGGGAPYASVVNNYYRHPTRYNINYAAAFKTEAIEYFKNVVPASSSDKVPPLPRSKDDLLNGRQIVPPLVWKPPTMTRTVIPTRFRSLYENEEQVGGVPLSALKIPSGGNSSIRISFASE